MAKLAEDEAHAAMKAEEARRLEQYEEAREHVGEERAEAIEAAMEAHGGEVPVAMLDGMSEGEVKDVIAAAEAEAERVNPRPRTLNHEPWTTDPKFFNRQIAVPCPIP